MPWADELLEDRSADIAAAILTLLGERTRWRHRWVETISVLSPELQRRRVSVDFTVPQELHAALALGEQWVVPLAWLSRRQLVNFDLMDRERRAVPLMLASQTAYVTRDVLVAAAVRGGWDVAGSAPDVLEVIEAVTQEEVGPTDPASLLERARELRLGEDFTALVGAATRGFLLLAVVDDVAMRQVLKWQTDELREPTGFVVRSALEGLDEAASTHVELELPDFTEAMSFSLFDDLGGAAEGEEARADVELAAAIRQESPSRERPRLLLRPAPSARRPFVRAELQVSPWEFVVPALVMSVVAAVVLGAGLLSGIADALTAPTAGTASVAATVVLATFAALSGLVLRVESHPFVRRLLATSRLALAVVAVALIAAATPIGLQLGEAAITAGWIAGFVAAVGSSCVLLADVVRHTRIGGA